MMVPETVLPRFITLDQTVEEVVDQGELVDEEGGREEGAQGDANEILGQVVERVHDRVLFV